MERVVIPTSFGDVTVDADRFKDAFESAIVFQYAQREARDALGGPANVDVTTLLTPELRAARVLTGDSIFDVPEHVPAVWGRDDRVLWAAGQGMMIDGQQGVGKTTVAQQLVLHRVGVRSGPFLGYPVVVDERPVLYLALDRPHQALGSFRRMVTPADAPLLGKRLVIWRGPLPVDVLAGTTVLADFCEEVCPGLGTVVCDSVKDLAVGVSKDDVGAGLNIAWQELIARNVELLLLHHERKAQNGAERRHSLDDVYGSTWLTSGLGSVIALEGQPGDVIIDLRHLKQPATPVELKARHDHAAGLTSVHTGFEDMEEVLREAGDTGITAQEAAERLFGRTEEKDLRKARNQLNKLVERVVARKEEGQRTAAGARGDRWFVDSRGDWARGHRQPPTAATDGGTGA